MSKPWKPGRQTVALNVEARPSKIRRAPVQLADGPQAVRKVEPPSRKQELWGGIAGILLFAGAIAAATVGIASATIFNDDPEADAQARRFGQCYNAFGPNCVLDGGTIYAGGEKVAIAGIKAPAIQDAACADEQSRGIDAAVQLADLLNSGPVTLSAPFRDAAGRVVRKVAAGGHDVGEKLVDAGLARPIGAGSGNWCSGGEAGS